MALNTLSNWHRRIKGKTNQRGELLELKKDQLDNEEEKSNILMSDYYVKLKELMSLKDEIKEVQ